MSRSIDRHRRLCATAVLFVCTALLACGRGSSVEALRSQQERGEYEATIEPLRNLLRDRPEDPEVNFLYAHALVATQRPSLAGFALRKAMEDPNWVVRAGLELANASLAAADYNEAVIAATKVLEREPDNLDALLVRANAEAYWRKTPENALRDVARVLELDPDSLDAMKPRILALLALQQADEARAAFQELGRRLDEIDAPESTRSWYCVTRAVFTAESGDLPGARKLWEECLVEYPAVPDVVFSALDFYDGQNEPEHAITLLQNALAKAPENQAYRSALADRLRRAGRTDEGESLLKEATNNEDPQSSAMAWLELGRFRRNAMNPSGAAEAMKRAYEIGKESVGVAPQLPFEYAEVLLLSKQYDAALEMANQLTVPAHQHLIRARAEQERGNPRVALEEFSKAFRLWPDNPWARYYAGRAAESVGDFDRALEEYRTSIRIDAGATDARTRAAQLLFAEGKPRYATQMLRQPDETPLDPVGVLLWMRLSGQFGGAEQVEQLRKEIDRSDPAVFAARIAELARGVGDSSAGPAAGLKLLRSTRDLNYRDPAHAAALRRLVQLSHASGARGTPPELAAALKAPGADGASAIQEIRGLDRELAGDLAGAQAAYQLAVKLDPQNARALAGLGRLARASDPAAAIGFFDSAAAADPGDPEPARLAAELVAANGKPDEAVQRLETLLTQHPLDAEAARVRAKVDADRGVGSDAALDWARRSSRVGGGADALDLVAKIHTLRGETEEATRAADRAKALRDRKAPPAEPEEPAEPEQG